MRFANWQHWLVEAENFASASNLFVFRYFSQINQCVLVSPIRLFPYTMKWRVTFLLYLFSNCQKLFGMKCWNVRWNCIDHFHAYGIHWNFHLRQITGDSAEFSECLKIELEIKIRTNTMFVQFEWFLFANEAVY